MFAKNMAFLKESKSRVTVYQVKTHFLFLLNFCFSDILHKLVSQNVFLHFKIMVNDLIYIPLQNECKDIFSYHN